MDDVVFYNLVPYIRNLTQAEIQRRLEDNICNTRQENIICCLEITLRKAKENPQASDIDDIDLDYTDSNKLPELILHLRSDSLDAESI